VFGVDHDNLRENVKRTAWDIDSRVPVRVHCRLFLYCEGVNGLES